MIFPPKTLWAFSFPINTHGVGNAYFDGNDDDIDDKNTYDCQRVHVRGSDYSTAIALTGTASCPQWW